MFVKIKRRGGKTYYRIGPLKANGCQRRAILRLFRYHAGPDRTGVAGYSGHNEISCLAGTSDSSRTEIYRPMESSPRDDIGIAGRGKDAIFGAQNRGSQDILAPASSSITRTWSSRHCSGRDDSTDQGGLPEESEVVPSRYRRRGFRSGFVPASHGCQGSVGHGRGAIYPYKFE